MGSEEQSRARGRREGVAEGGWRGRVVDVEIGVGSGGSWSGGSKKLWRRDVTWRLGLCNWGDLDLG